MYKFICKFTNPNSVDNKRVITLSFIAKDENTAKKKLLEHFSTAKNIIIKQGKLK